MVNIADDTRDRIIKLEQKFESHSDKMNDTADKVDKMYDLMNQAKGAKWAILGVAGITGFLGGKGGMLLTSLFGIK